MTGRHGGELNEPWLIAELCRFFKNQHIAECAAEETRQRRIMRDHGAGRKSMKGLGQPKYEFSESLLAHWRARLGHNPLKDSGWKKYMEKHFGDLIKPKSIGEHEIMVGYGSKSFGVTKKFTKKY